ncbi:MAG: deoxyribodipyrimidine photo-lyase [Pseudomonadales bacterium]|nr:deoxyribodipyrimidine photo-lyase [Pseudomonadales bacterium]
MNPTIFLIRRDLRIQDNAGLNEAASAADVVYPCFILDQSLLQKYAGHDYRLAFLKGSLQALDEQLQTHGSGLWIEQGEAARTLKKLIQKTGARRVVTNRDYTPASRRRDEELRAVCESVGVTFQQVGDYLLNEPEQVYKPDGGHYSVFTPFYNRARQLYVAPPVTADNLHLADSEQIPAKGLQLLMKLPEGPSEMAFQAGRPGAEAVLQQLTNLSAYATERDFPALPGTSRLSAHLKFGTLSVREAHAAITAALGNDHPLVRQLYWRDFFTHIAWHDPGVFTHAFKRQYDAIPWATDTDKLAAWKAGETGFPIIDAGMKELAATGYMHNRVRMITASFLVKNLHLSWYEGEAHFARYLIDYDPCLNNGNWQWAASTGSDAQPYFRVFNPWRQQVKFDPDATYIKRWVPALAKSSARAIHGLEKQSSGYIEPIVDLKKSAERIKALFKAVASGS